MIGLFAPWIFFLAAGVFDCGFCAYAAICTQNAARQGRSASRGQRLGDVMKRNKNTRERGHAVVEIALMAPWIFFLFVGVFDVGFFSYAAICTQNAARQAAVRTAADEFSQSNALACAAALGEMNRLPNVPSLGSCSATPLKVTQKTLCTQGTV